MKASFFLAREALGNEFESSQPNHKKNANTFECDLAEETFHLIYLKSAKGAVDKLNNFKNHQG